MSKYTFSRIGSSRFESLAQALLENKLRLKGSLIQFEEGKDGGREATWEQSSNHAGYERPANEKSDVPKQWVFQVKYHDLDVRGWGTARADIQRELEAELTKLLFKYHVPCHKYVLITNVPFSGVRHVGTRDKILAIIQKWKAHVPEIEVWDAVDLSRMLDADADARTAYLDDILPGDVLRALLKKLDVEHDNRKKIFHTYLKHIVQTEQDAKTEEAGDDNKRLPLEKVFVDLNVVLEAESIKHLNASAEDILGLPGFRVDECDVPDRYENYGKVPASHAFLCADHESMLLRGGPGVGKSTITQFLALYHAARLVDAKLAARLGSRLKSSKNTSPAQLEAHSRVRFPLRIELRRYAQWMSKAEKNDKEPFLAGYLAEQIGKAASSTLSMDSVFDLVSGNPVLLILDGLDEVPHPTLRDKIFSELQKFMVRCEGESLDIQLLLSTRPQGYRGEFDRFTPVEWTVDDLSRRDFDKYAADWIGEMIPNSDEKADAHERIVLGMQTRAVQQMAKSLLQATVMLTIVRKKFPIPHARHRLFGKYVEVIFSREKNKKTVREHEEMLLRLHEMVGFNLICKMEQASGERTLGEKEFRLCVLKVIEDYGRGPIGNLSALVNEVMTLTKNRLCLLAGKGEDQQNVDFVIQTFREYFAAEYLANHENADPDRVYRSLIARRHVWANVLQFYAASQQKAVQSAWISEADGETEDQKSSLGIINVTRTRRALLGVLPEFTRPKNDYVSRAFKNLFAEPSKWTWAHQGETNALLEAFVGDIVYANLRRLFSVPTVNDEDQLYVELSLLARAASTPVEAEDIKSIMQDLCRDDSCWNAVLKAATENRVLIRVPSARSESFTAALRRHVLRSRHVSKDLYSAMSVDELLDFAFLGHAGRVIREAITPQIDLSGLVSFLLPEAPLSSAHAQVTVPQYLLPRKAELSEGVVELLSRSKAKVAPYLLALVGAIKEPFSPELFEKANEQCVLLGDRISVVLSVRSQLGLSPSKFPSVADWQTWKAGLYSYQDTLRSWVRVAGADDLGWLSFVVHPDCWADFESIFDDQQYHALMRLRADVQMLSSVEVIPFQSLFVRDVHSNQLLRTCFAVVDLIKRRGSGALSNPLFMGYSLATRESSSPLVSEEVEKLLQEARSVRLPSGWANAVAALCCEASDVNIDDLLSYFADYLSSVPSWSGLARNMERLLLERLLSKGTELAIRVAAELIGDAGRLLEDKSVLHGLASQVASRFCDLLLRSESRLSGEDLRLLTWQVPSLRELDVWADARACDVVRSDVWMLERVSERVATMPSRCLEAERGALRERLTALVQMRTKLPLGIGAAAVDGLLRLDEMEAPPLEDADWVRIEPRT